MSKKRDKVTKDSKDRKDDKHKKHCKSRKTDEQKWGRPDGYYKEYDARRKGQRPHDSQVFRETIKKVLDGAGCVMLGAGYDASENYGIIRIPAGGLIRTCKNRIVWGFGPRAETLRWQERNPEEFEDTYHQRSIVESEFSSFKCRFTAVVRAKKQATKTAAAPQARLLQSVVSGTRQETRLVCLAYAVQPCSVLAQDASNHILPREIPSYTGNQKR